MSEKAPPGVLAHDEYAQTTPQDSTGTAGRRQAGALNVVENPLMVNHLSTLLLALLEPSSLISLPVARFRRAGDHRC